MNEARALVHVYTDGSVSISTGAVEMGQGANTKMIQVAAAVFSLPSTSIKIQGGRNRGGAAAAYSFSGGLTCQ